MENAMKRPAESDLDFWNRKAKSYAKKPVPDESAYQATLARVKAHLTHADRVLEVGCGTGSTALTLAPHARNYLATDVSREMVSIAKQKLGAQGNERLRFSEGDLDDPALHAGSFDVVLAFNLLHLLADTSAALRRIHSLLRAGGLFISKTPCVGDSSKVLRAVIPILRGFGQAPFVNFVKQATLQNDIASAGFEILETGLYPAKSQSLFVVARSVTPA